MTENGALSLARSAAIAYTASFVSGSVLSIKRGYGAEPLGIRTGLSPAADLLVGNGAALAAPWSMIALLWHAVIAARAPGKKGRNARARMAGLAALFLAGAVAEPVSHRMVARELPMPDAVIAGLNIVLPVAIMGGSLASLLAPPPSTVDRLRGGRLGR